MNRTAFLSTCLLAIGGGVGCTSSSGSSTSSSSTSSSGSSSGSSGGTTGACAAATTQAQLFDVTVASPSGWTGTNCPPTEAPAGPSTGIWPVYTWSPESIGVAVDFSGQNPMLLLGEASGGVSTFLGNASEKLCSQAMQSTSVKLTSTASANGGWQGTIQLELGCTSSSGSDCPSASGQAFDCVESFPVTAIPDAVDAGNPCAGAASSDISLAVALSAPSAATGTNCPAFQCPGAVGSPIPTESGTWVISSATGGQFTLSGPFAAAPLSGSLSHGTYQFSATSLSSSVTTTTTINLATGAWTGSMGIEASCSGAVCDGGQLPGQSFDCSTQQQIEAAQISATQSEQ